MLSFYKKGTTYFIGTSRISDSVVMHARQQSFSLRLSRNSRMSELILSDTGAWGSTGTRRSSRAALYAFRSLPTSLPQPVQTVLLAIPLFIF